MIFFIIKSSVLKKFMRGSCHFGNSSNFEISVECRNICLFSAGSKRTNYTAFFLNEITQPFLDLEGAPECISQQHLKNTTTKIM